MWRGTAFHCSDSDGSLSLRHTQSNFANVTEFYKECIDGPGTVVAQGIGTIENSTDIYYISQLNLTLGLDTNNKTVQCAHDNGTQLNIVDTTTVTTTTGSMS